MKLPTVKALGELPGVTTDRIWQCHHGALTAKPTDVMHMVWISNTKAGVATTGGCGCARFGVVSGTMVPTHYSQARSG